MPRRSSTPKKLYNQNNMQTLWSTMYSGETAGMAQQELRLRAVQEAVHNNLCTAGAIGKCAYRHCSDVCGTGLKGVRKGHDSERPRQAGCGDCRRIRFSRLACLWSTISIVLPVAVVASEAGYYSIAGVQLTCRAARVRIPVLGMLELQQTSLKCFIPSCFWLQATSTLQSVCC